MSAVHKPPRGLYPTRKKNPLDHLVDFGEQPPSNTSDRFVESQNQRLQKVIKELEDLDKRIDRLMKDE